MSENTINPDGEKKAKRPRIGAPQAAGSSDRAHYEKISQKENEASADGEGSARPYQPRPYQPRPYQQRQGYQPRRPYGEFQQETNNAAGEGEAAPRAEGESSGYQPRQYQRQGYRPQGQGGFQNRPYQSRQGGYQNRQQGQGGYQPRQGGFQNRQQGQGGYQPRQGGYQNRQQGQGYRPQGQGGFQQRPQGQGGYRPQGQGGFQNRGFNHQGQGGFQHRNQGGKFRQGGRPQGGFFPGHGKSFTPRPKRIEYEMPIPDPNEQIRLNKFMSNSGLCSRREADEFIQQGLVKVNGKVVTELGTKITHSDVVEYDEKVLALESKCYILLNKPKDCVTTSDDPQDRLTVLDLVKGACNERIYPVGRLDRNTTGVLLLTNDGDLASKLTHPKYVKKKIYHVWTDRDISEEDMQKIADGIELEDGPVQVDAISYATETDKNQAGIEIHSGRNRIVRRIFEYLGYEVKKLDRVYYAGLTKKNLKRGAWRFLTDEEVRRLKTGQYE